MLQLYNMFPRLVSWIKNRQLILKNVEMTVRDVKDLIKQLKETLNPHTCRGLVDCFLIRKQKEEVRQHLSSLVIEQQCRIQLIYNTWVLFLLGLLCNRHSLQREKLDFHSNKPVCCWY